MLRITSVSKRTLSNQEQVIPEVHERVRSFGKYSGIDALDRLLDSWGLDKTICGSIVRGCSGTSGESG